MATLVCSSCGKEYGAAETSAAQAETCPECTPGSAQHAAAATATPEASRHCGICLSPLAAAEAAVACPACGASYHEECWAENKGCAVYGCSHTPHVEQRSAVEIPVSFWGQENKPCPACGREILAAAIRCRFCGAVFSSARPEDASAFHLRSEREKRLPRFRQTIVWFFVLSLIPCLAPVGGVWGLIWYATHRRDVEVMPSLYSALCKIGICVGLGQTTLMILLTLIYAATQGF